LLYATPPLLPFHSCQKKLLLLQIVSMSSNASGTPKDKDKSKEKKTDRDLDLANSVRGVWLVKVGNSM